MLRSLANGLLYSANLDSLRLLAVSLKRLHLTSERSAAKRKDSKDVKPQQVSAMSRDMQNKLKEAAITAAQSLQGNWSRSAEELIARLQMLETPPHIENQGESKQESLQVEETSPNHLLTSMKVGRDYTSEKARTPMRKRSTDKTGLYTEPQDFTHSHRKYFARKNEVFSELYSVPRLGIFDAEKHQKLADHSPYPPGLWESVTEEKIKASMGGLPKNAFEEMVQWTKEGKLWKFPIDNEADMTEERKYSFQDHVFFDKFLQEFPEKGPVRKFMELITLGLSQNPFITVPEKHDHLRWFADYFRQKQEVLVAAIGEDGKLNDLVAKKSSDKKKIKGRAQNK